MTCKTRPLLCFLARSTILLPPKVFCTFPLARFFWCRLVFFTFSIFATPLTKYCDLWLLINIHFALGRVDCAFHFGRSRARGVEKTRIVIPMLHGKRVFVWFLCSVGIPFLLVSTSLRWECSKTCFSDKFHMICSLLLVCCARAERDAVFFICLASNNASHPAWGSSFWILIFVFSTPQRWECTKTFFYQKIS